MRTRTIVAGIFGMALLSGCATEPLLLVQVACCVTSEVVESL